MHEETYRRKVDWKMSCQKCSCTATSETYHQSCSQAYNEHLHHRCYNCGYSWVSPTRDQYEDMIKELKGFVSEGH
jgi:hypothetical protein